MPSRDLGLAQRRVLREMSRRDGASRETIDHLTEGYAGAHLRSLKDEGLVESMGDGTYWRLTAAGRHALL